MKGFAYSGGRKRMPSSPRKTPKNRPKKEASTLTFKQKIREQAKTLEDLHEIARKLDWVYEIPKLEEQWVRVDVAEAEHNKAVAEMEAKYDNLLNYFQKCKHDVEKKLKAELKQKVRQWWQDAFRDFITGKINLEQLKKKFEGLLGELEK